MIDLDNAVEAETRPRTRGDCRGGARPCPYAGCRFSLVLLDVSPVTGRIWERDEAEVEAMTDTCALDVADRGGMDVAELGAVFHMTHQGASLAVKKAAEKLRPLLSVDLLEGWTHQGDDVTQDETLAEILDDAFKAAVQRAYERIVPASERGAKAIRAAKRGGR